MRPPGQRVSRSPSLGRKVSGKTKQEVREQVREKLKAIHAELNVGLQSSAGYTVRMAMDDWLEHGLSGRSARTVQLYRNGVKPLTDGLGVRPLRKLSAADVWSALGELSDQLSTRSLQIAHNRLVRAIRQAEADDLVGRTWPPWSGRPLVTKAGRQRRCQSSRLNCCCGLPLLSAQAAPPARSMPTWSCC